MCILLETLAESKQICCFLFRQRVDSDTREEPYIGSDGKGVRSSRQKQHQSGFLHTDGSEQLFRTVLTSAMRGSSARIAFREICSNLLTLTIHDLFIFARFSSHHRL